jgi:hypothetical protein
MPHFTLITAEGVTEFRCTARDTCLLTTLEFKVQDDGEGEVLLQKKHKNGCTPLIYICNTQCPTKPIGDKMTTSRFTPSTNEAALRRRLARAISDAGLSHLISMDQIVITPNGFTLGTFDLDEMSAFTNTLEDIAEAAGTQVLARRRSKSMLQSMEVPVRIPVDFKPAKVFKRIKAMI